MRRVASPSKMGCGRGPVGLLAEALLVGEDSVKFWSCSACVYSWAKVIFSSAPLTAPGGHDVEGLLVRPVEAGDLAVDELEERASRRDSSGASRPRAL